MLSKLLNLKTLFILATAFVLGGLLIAPAVQSGGPQFNIFPEDQELLMVANSSQQTDWNDPTVGNPGDAIAFVIYYHNGIENTVAKNTRVRADLPATASQQLVVNASVWADNADAVIDTGTVNVNERAQKLEYIPGTTKWYPDRSTEPTSLPDGITENGINIGDIQGCWPFVGRVIFQARLVGEPEPDGPEFVKSKSAWNITRDKDATKIMNRPLNLIEYTLKTKNVGDVAGKFTVKDDISKVFKYSNLKNKFGGTVNGNYISWPTVTIQPGETVVNKFRVRIKEAIPVNKVVHLLNIYGNRVDVPATREVEYFPGLTINKTVRNVTRNQSSFVKHNSASEGDILQYNIRVINEGDVELTNLKIKDILPNDVYYVTSSAFYGYGPENINNKLSNKIVSSGVNLGKLVYQGQTAGKYEWLRIRLKVGVKYNLGVGNHSLVNKVQTSADYQTEISSGTLTGDSEADTVVKITAKPALTINKHVKNLTEKTGWVKYVSAYAGDEVGYRITIKNTGQTVITDLRATDVLPANVYFQTGSARLTYRGSNSKLGNSFVNQFVNLPNLKQNEKLTIVFKADTDNELAEGSVLVNLAQAKGAGLKETSKATINIVADEEPVVKGPLVKSGQSAAWLIGVLAVVCLGFWIYAIRVFR